MVGKSMILTGHWSCFCGYSNWLLSPPTRLAHHPLSTFQIIGILLYIAAGQCLVSSIYISSGVCSMVSSYLLSYVSPPPITSLLLPCSSGLVTSNTSRLSWASAIMSWTRHYTHHTHHHCHPQHSITALHQFSHTHYLIISTPVYCCLTNIWWEPWI